MEWRVERGGLEELHLLDGNKEAVLAVFVSTHVRNYPEASVEIRGTGEPSGVVDWKAGNWTPGLDATRSDSC